MAQGGPPDEMNTRHTRAAMLMATGMFTAKDVAERLGYSPNRFYIIAASPLFKALVAKYQERMADKDMDEAVRLVMDDTKGNVEFLKDMRDGSIVDDPKVLRARLRASEVLFERQIPKKREVVRDDTVTIRLEQRIVDRLNATMIEDGAVVDVEVEGEGGGVGTAASPKTLEEFESSYTPPSDPDVDA